MIYVDADACPVKNLIVKVSKEFDFKVIMFVDTSHQFEDSYCEVVVVDKGRDSVDFALINRVKKRDIVVTQDFGVATMALSKNAYAINQNGLVYNKDNIDMLLFERHISQKVRRSGGKTSGHRKRNKEDDENFINKFRSLCQKSLDVEI